MTQVDFYVLPQSGSFTVGEAVGRLAEKALSRGHRIFVHVSDEQQGHHLDSELWTFRPESFIPHALLGSDTTERVTIGWDEPPLAENDVLINTTAIVPNFFSRFHRLAEIVSPDEAALAASREAWRYYRDRGYPLAKYDL
ncbi:MAG: DNA polymerase III subunit chi [Luminiphilus sp.]|nr:DNA polymerase III subunit chi [Luminiphilus sp.]